MSDTSGHRKDSNLREAARAKTNLERGNVVVVQLMAKAQQSTVAANHILNFGTGASHLRLC